MRRLTPGFLVSTLLAAPLVVPLLGTAPAVGEGAAPCTITGTPGNDVLIGTGSTDDVICGRGGNDVLHGLGGDDVLRGGAGDDRIFPGPGSNVVHGNDGRDTLRYDKISSAGVVVDLDAGTTTGAVTDTVTTVEDVVGTNRKDRLAGTDGRNRLIGRGGNDLLIGRWGADVLRGAAGNDAITPDRGDDVVNGGSGRDKVSYRHLVGLGMTIDLTAGQATGGGGSDALTSIEDAVGSPKGDLITGTDGPNRIDSLGGVDRIVPGLGNDEIVGGGDLGGKEGEGIADTVDYSAITTTGVDVDLASGTVTGPGNGTVDGIINVIGTDQSDTIVSGESPWTVLLGRGGADTLTGDVGCGFWFGGDGDDVIQPGDGGGCGDVTTSVGGGDGADTVTYAGVSWSLWVEPDFARWSVFKDEVGIDETLVSTVETFIATGQADHLYGGLGAAAVTFVGGGGADDIDTTDGVGGDTIQADATSTCAGDLGDTVNC